MPRTTATRNNNDLKRVEPGDPINAAWANSLIDRINKVAVSSRGDFLQSAARGRREIVVNSTGKTLPPYSVVGADYGSGVFVEGAVRYAASLDLDSDFIFTNGANRIKKGGEFEPVPLTEPQYLNAEDSDDYVKGEWLTRKEDSIVVSPADDDDTKYLICLETPDDTGRVWGFRPVDQGGDVSITGGGGGGCGCSCIQDSDLIVDGIHTTTVWTAEITGAVPKKVDGGYIILRPGSYVLEWEEANSRWYGDFLTDIQIKGLIGSENLGGVGLLAYRDDNTEASHVANYTAVEGWMLRDVSGWSEFHLNIQGNIP